MGLLPSRPARAATTKQVGDAAEDQALGYLQAKGLQFVARNYRTPGRGGGEIDLILRDLDGTLVFVEVRKRSRGDHGGAAASVGHVKQRRIILRRGTTCSPCAPCRRAVLTWW